MSPAWPGAPGRGRQVDLKGTLDFFKTQLEECTLCPRRCGVNRLKGEVGFCNAGADLKVSSYCLHTGEEPPVSGRHGSGTIFFAHCNMACVYCQNYPISQLGHGNTVDPARLAAMMLDLETRGAHNINLVTPTHFLPRIVEAVLSARQQGLVLPILYNSSGYESTETVRMLEGIIQIFLVDMRYSTVRSALKYSNAPDYPRHNRLAVKQMLDQVGPLKCSRGVAVRGVIIRHLLIPSLMQETRETIEFISRTLDPDVPVSLMSQYFPANRAHDFPEINRKITKREYSEAVNLLERHGLGEGWIQDPASAGGPVA
jgi:putative pyruvate formate lyase activating enzyme